MTIDEDRTCPATLISNPETGDSFLMPKRCRAFEDERTQESIDGYIYSSCKNGHPIREDQWIPLPYGIGLRRDEHNT